MAILSGDTGVKAVVGLIAALLLFAPFVFQDVRSFEVAARICVFIVLVASYDLLIGCTGIVSFARTMFFGFGAYGAVIALKEIGPTWGALILGKLAGVLLSLVDGIARRAFVAPGERDLLCHGHPRSSLHRHGAGLAAQRLHRRRGRDHLPHARAVQDSDQAFRGRRGPGGPGFRGEAQRQARGLFLRVRRVARAVRGPNAPCRLAARHRAQGDP